VERRMPSAMIPSPIMNTSHIPETPNSYPKETLPMVEAPPSTTALKVPMYSAGPSLLPATR
jgi:hypothetical protein